MCGMVDSRLGGTTVILVPPIEGALPGVEPLDGEGARGRLFRFSVIRVDLEHA